MAVRYPSLAARRQVARRRDQANRQALADAAAYTPPTADEMKEHMRRIGLSVYQTTIYEWRCAPCGIRSEPTEDYDACDADRIRHYQDAHYEGEIPSQ